MQNYRAVVKQPCFLYKENPALGADHISSSNRELFLLFPRTRSRCIQWDRKDAPS